MHELRTRRERDPDKTAPPTPVEELWGGPPPRASAATAPRPETHTPRTTPALSHDDALTLYRAARDCMVAGAYTGATALLRRLILHVAVEQANEAGTRDHAERLFGVAETLLELTDGRKPSSNA